MDFNKIFKNKAIILTAILILVALATLAWPVVGTMKSQADFKRKNQLKVAQIEGEIAIYSQFFNTAKETGKITLQEIVGIKKDGTLQTGEEITLKLCNNEK